MFNHLPASDYERHGGQSASSGLRRLNRGNCCTPKFALPYSPRNCQIKSQSSPRVAQSKISYTVKTRVCVLIKKMKFSKVQSSLICLQIWSSILISSFKTFSSKLHSQNPKLHYSQLQGQNGHLTVKSSNFWSTSHFEATNIIWSMLDHDSQSMAQKVSRCKSFHIWTVEKVNCNLTKA